MLAWASPRTAWTSRRSRSRASCALAGGGTIRPEDLRARLDGHGASVSRQAFDESLDRLELGYLLISDGGGRLRCPIPLLSWWIGQSGDLAVQAADAATDYAHEAAQQT